MLDFTEQRAQFMLLAGMVMLGWLLIRRLAKRTRKSQKLDQQIDEISKNLAKNQVSGVSLTDAPVHTMRWQAEMFDLQRELKGELETKIAVVQSILRQADQRIAKLEQLLPRATPLTDLQIEKARSLQENGCDFAEIANQIGVPVGDLEMAFATNVGSEASDKGHT